EASISSAPGIAAFTACIAEMMASRALAASRVKSSAMRPCWPMPTAASSHPASASAPMNCPGSALASGSRNFKVNSYSLIVGIFPALFLLRFFAYAVVHDASKLLAMIARILWRAPDAGDAELAATAGVIVVGAEHPAPGVAAALLERPAVRFGVLDRGFNLGFRMLGSSHCGPVYEG